MLTKEQILEIRNHINKSENPLFFFDDDPDGLCSYLMLKKYVQKGKGAVLKTSSILGLDLYHKVEEYSPDLVVILDIPLVDQDFLDKIKVPVIYIDHHPPIKRQGVKYYNPLLNNPDQEIPVSYCTYQISEEKELFLGTLGCISDWYYPEFAKDFSEKYPDLLPKKMKNPPEIIFDSKLGELINIFAFSLKNPTSKVHRIANLLLKIENPYELLNKETSRSKFILNEIKKHIEEYNGLLNDLKKSKPSKEKLFIYPLPPTRNSYTSNISNYLIYKYPKKIVMVTRYRQDRIIFSIRSTVTNIEEVLAKSLESLDGFGGGHKGAVGASIAKDQFDEFIKRFKEYIK